MKKKAISRNVSIVDVGPRDGLQNESKTLSVDSRFKFIQLLSQAGMKRIEAGAFVSSKWVPQMAGSDELCHKINQAQANGQIPKNIVWSCLVPNERGMESALECQVKEIAIFALASETFSKKNINCTIAESLDRYKSVIAIAKKNNVRVRAYLSMCF